MKAQQWMAVVGLGGWLWACGDHDTTTMSDYAQAFDQHVEALRAEQTAHFSAVTAMIGVDRIGPAEQTHATRIDDHLDSMSQIIGGMIACAEGHGMQFDAADLAVATHDLRSECDEHFVLMMSAHDMTTAGAEEIRHQDVVGMQTERLRRQVGTMMQPGWAYSCSRCPSCGM
jgi:hypothetical protein